jgi:hypothetical protein
MNEDEREQVGEELPTEGAALMAGAPKILVVLEGGVVQAVVSDSPELDCGWSPSTTPPMRTRTHWSGSPTAPLSGRGSTAGARRPRRSRSSARSGEDDANRAGEGEG